MKRVLEALPNFPEGELAILGALLIDNAIIPTAFSILEPKDFYHSGHRTVLEAIWELFSTDQPVDWATLSKELKTKGQLESVGGVDFLVSLADAVPSTANITHYCEQVKRAAAKRRVIHACQKAITDLYSEDDLLNDVTNSIQEACLFVVADNKHEVGNITMKDAARQLSDQLEVMVDSGAPTGLSTGFRSIDKATGGLQKPDLWIFCARPSMGKTALATQILVNIAKNISDGFVILFSLEMDQASITKRILASESGFNLAKLRQGPISANQLVDLQDTLSAIAEYPLIINESSTTTPMDVYTHTVRAATSLRMPPVLVAVDYLQLMRSNTKLGSREQEIAAISRDLKMCAKRLGCPVIALSQLNRKCEERDLKHRRPRISDLRESGAIEQDADGVIGLFRMGYYIERESDNEAEIERYKNHAEGNVLKNRNGPIGIAELHWKPETTKFYDKASFDYEGYEPPEDGVRLDLL